MLVLVLVEVNFVVASSFVIKEKGVVDAELGVIALVVMTLVLRPVETGVVVEASLSLPTALLLVLAVAAAVEKVPSGGVHWSHASPVQPSKHSHTFGVMQSPLKQPWSHTAVHNNECVAPPADARATAAANWFAVTSALARRRPPLGSLPETPELERSLANGV